MFLTTRPFIWNPVLEVLKNVSGRYKQKYWIYNTKNDCKGYQWSNLEWHYIKILCHHVKALRICVEKFLLVSKTEQMLLYYYEYIDAIGYFKPYCKMACVCVFVWTYPHFPTTHFCKGDKTIQLEGSKSWSWLDVDKRIK